VTDDHRDLSLARKIVLDKPRAAHDMINRPHYAGRREAAGGPLATDVLACTLKPLQRSDFSVSFTTKEWTRLRAAFPSGVCDWSAAGAEQQPTIPWLTYARGPGGEPLGPPPRSVPLRPNTR
jgi:Tannase-like family of unknown function (DUF6351)